MAPASGVRTYMCLCLNFMLCMLQFLPQSYTKSVLTIPHDAEPGYFISQIACTRPEVRIKTFGENSKEFYDKFHITNTGVLVVKSRLSLSSDVDKVYYFSAYQSSRCFDRVKSHDNFIIHVRDSKKVVHFSKRLYSFTLLKSQSGVTKVQNVGLVHFNHDSHIPEDRVKFFLKGAASNNFHVVQVSSDSLRIETSIHFDIKTSRVLHFRLFAKYNDDILGVVDINIIVIPQGTRIQPALARSSVPHHVQSLSHVNTFGSGVPVLNFDQIQNDGHLESQTLLRRVRRQTGIPTSTLTFAVNETATGKLFTVDPGVPPSTVYTFNLTDATPENIFSVDSSGNVSLKNDRKLDYDFGKPHTYSIYLDVISGSEVLRRVIVTLNVLNVNDEPPYFTTRPTPYLATIPEEAPPNLKVFQVQAVDPDGGSIVYFLDGVNEDFGVQVNTGWIETKREIKAGTDFNVSVHAVDSSASTSQRTPSVIVEIRRGTRKPQFLSESYEAKVEEVNLEDQTFETTDKNGEKVKIEAINFQERLGGTLQYTVYENVNTKSTRFAVENGNLKTLQPLDYETDPHVFTLTVMALDSYTGLSSIAQLVVNVVDKNEYAPLFSKSTYTARVRETLAQGSIVTTVSASDRDANTNISYTVTNSLFAVPTSGNGQTGNVIVNGVLDYDKTPRNRYEFDIIATDNGQNPYPLNATARIIVNLINENDQAPKFDNNLVTSLVNNTAGGSTVITVRATDEDGDGITYSFQGNTNIYQLFEIERDSGKIILRQNTKIPEGTDRYELPVVATDDGSCCESAPTLSSSATVVINIIDAVNLKPNFVSCSSYASTVLEDQEPGAAVTTVSASDQNRGENGVVEYYIIEDQKNTAALFSINNMTGELVTSARLDRETQSSRNLFITVRAVDRGNPPLDDYCTFPITVGDVNDNDPIFRSSQYTGQVLKAASVGTVVLTVQADDSDLGMNSAIQYSITSNPEDLFLIDKDTGEITVKRQLNTTKSNVVLAVEAKDQGTPARSSTSSVNITISTDLNVKPPRWTSINPLFEVKENASVSFIVGTLTAENEMLNISDPGLDFNIVGLNNRLSQRDPSGNFIIEKELGAESVNIKIDKILDFETKQEYTITIRASNRAGGNGIYSDNTVKIRVEDVNDVNPEFQNINPDSGTIDIYVKENSPVGTVVSGIVATDGDLTAPFNEVRYSLLNTNGRFDIDEVTGVITTRQVFDREATSDDSSKYYYVTAVAVDRASSSKPGTNGPNTGTAGVQIIIQDENDNTPYFAQPLYTASVQEDSFIGSSIVTVAASDNDDLKFTTFTYTLEGSSLFDVNRRTGTIRVAGNLDYETPPNTYTLTLTVDDGKFSNRTNVQITIIDTNDNTPVFTNDTYVIRTITENEDYTNRPPILKVHATDPDTERDKGMDYEIAQGDTVITNLFFINRTTGDLSLRGSLDRDRPNGREVYQFNVLAIDEPGSSTRLTGYATVQIFPIDVNDNDPFFLTSSLTATVREMSAIGVQVMTVEADDYDTGENAKLTYNIVDGSQTPREAFRMNPDGSVFTTVNDLDRETNPTYYFEVVASDNGVPKRSSTATATVNIKDINDNNPTFSQRVYQASIPETQSGRIMTITATDLDIDDQLQFQLTGEATTFFFMRQEETKIGSLDRTGVLEVYKKPDYEIPDQRNFNFSVVVTDSLHSDTAYVVIEIQDVNDEIPIINPPTIEIEKDESVPIGTILTTFTATDRDVDPNNGAFDFFISGKPINEMPNFYFSINENGEVSVSNSLDYEKISTHIVRILAIDRGLPPQTGTATLTVKVNDINDNAPSLRLDKNPIFMENTPPALMENVYVYGQDPDGSPYGGPFTFAEGTCASNNDACDNFDVRFTIADYNLDNGNGRAQIIPLSQFDREEKRFYELPIIMSDMRGVTGSNADKRLTATNTLTIEIGDQNDNPSSNGEQNIHVYNYKGMFANIVIGSANYVDKDDDRADKEFSLEGTSNYFNVSRDEGKIMMLAHVPSGRHTLTVNVVDKKNKRERPVKSYITIYIEELPEEAPYKSGSVRLTGITADEFVQGPLENFRSLLERKLRERNPSSKAQIISVYDTEVDGVKYCDVRYAALGSPYYPASKVDGVVDQNKDEFAKTLGNGASIAMVSIDMCLREICEGGGCHNKLIVKDEPNLVDAKGSSFVGVATEVKAECGCIAATNVTECSANYCLNNGICNKDLWGNLHCDCPLEFTGPRCQQTTHGFDGTGYALYESLRQCENSVTSIEFITLNENALILYNGPVHELQSLDPQDYIVLQMRSGYPELTINHGSGSLTLSLNGRDAQNNEKMAKLSDGKWHQIDIRRQGKIVTLTVDNCLAADNVDGVAQDRSPCETTGATKGENKFLNVNSQLQLGGRYSVPSYPPNIVAAKFSGCMRNLRHNGELYDLYTKGFYSGTTDGCPQEDNVCGKNSLDIPQCVHGTCQMTRFPNPPSDSGASICICNPGYRGTLCQNKTTVRDFRTDSFMDWQLTNDFINSLSSRQLDIQLQYRSRDQDGMIFHVQAQDSTEFMRLEIIDNILQVLYNFGDENRNLQMSEISASDGAWHTVYIKRRGQSLVLQLDGGEGYRYAERISNSLYQEMAVKGDHIYAGAQVSYEDTATIDSINKKDFSLSCMNDIRLDQEWFPMTLSENSESTKVRLQRDVNTNPGCVREDCTPAIIAQCAAQNKTCLSLWGAYECVCPKHHEPQGLTCVQTDYCGLLSPCHHLSTCRNEASNDYGYVCICHPTMTGRICNLASQTPGGPDDPDNTWVLPVILVICLLFLIVLIVIGIIFGRKYCSPSASDTRGFVDLEKEDYDIRENIVNYDEEGAGEYDNEGYDISRLRKPADLMTRMDRPDLMATNERPLKSGAPPGGHVGDFIEDRLQDADDDPSAPPHDTTRNFDYEGGGSDAGSLSSLNTTSSDGDQDYDYLNNWGPKFAKLADMYNNYEDSE